MVGQGTPLSFDISRIPAGDGWRSAGKFWCSKCDATALVPFKGGFNPSTLAEDVCRLGWQAKPFRKSSVTCPDCSDTKRRSNDVDGELRKVIPMMKPSPPPTNLTTSVSAPETPTNVTTSVIPPEPRRVQAETSKPVVVREVTAAQRVKIRGYLDKHFDDAQGAYLDDFDDQKIAELVAVPRITVERMREAAYGPILVDPATLALRFELDQLRKAVATMENGIADLKRKLAEVTDRVAGLKKTDAA